MFSSTKMYLLFLSAAFFFACGTESQAVQIDDEVAAARKYLKSIGAIFTTNDADQVIGLQFPEGISLNKQTWPYIGKLKELRDLDLGATYVGNEMLNYVGQLKELRNLNLFGNPLDSPALKQIENLEHLETLYLYRTYIDDGGIESIAKMKRLRRLNMFDTTLTDKGLDLLGTCKQLKNLSIGNSKAGNSTTGKFPESNFSKAGIERLKENLPETEITLWGGEKRLDTPETIQRNKLSDDKNPRRLLLENVAEAPNLSLRKNGSDWPYFLGPERNGKSSETGLRWNWSANPPKLLWHKRIGTGYAAPTVSKGRLLLYERVANDTGEDRFKEQLSCFHSESGEAIWTADFPTNYEDLNGYGDGPRSTPIVDNDRVFILSPAGILRCLQLVDGKIVWEVDLVHSFGCDLPTYGMGATPIIFNDLLIVVVGNQIGTKKNSSIVAFDKTNGIFRYGVGEQPASYATPVLYKSGNRNWCFAFNQNGLFGFDPDKGKMDFRFPWQANIAGSANAASPVVANDQVFISESYRLGGAKLRFFPGGAQVVWMDSRQVREKSMACHWNTPILHNGFLYGCSGRHRSDGRVKCVDWNSGRTVWQIKLEGRSSLTYVDGHFLNLSETGLLTCFQASQQGYIEVGRLDQKSEVVPSYPAWTAPVVAKGLMYLRGKHELICYEINSE